MYRATDSLYIDVCVCVCVCVWPDISWNCLQDMTNPLEKEKQELDLQVSARPFLNLCLFRNKPILEPRSFRPREVNSNLHSPWVNDISSKINLETPGQNDHTPFPKFRQTASSKYVQILQGFWFLKSVCDSCRHSHQAHTEREPYRTQQQKRPPKIFRPLSWRYLCRSCNEQAFLCALMCTVLMYRPPEEAFQGLLKDDILRWSYVRWLKQCSVSP